MPAVIKKIIPILISLLFAVYLPLLLRYYFQLSAIKLAFAALIGFVITFFIIGYITRKAGNNLGNKRLLVASLGVAGLILISSSKKIIPRAQLPHVSITVTALGEKNDSAQSSEVWLTRINDGEKDLDLNKVLLPPGWELKNNYIACYQHQPAVLKISVRGVEQLHIDFTRHAWSGKIKIEDGAKTTIVDLYHSNSTEYYTYSTVSGFDSKSIPASQKAVLTAISFLALATFWYLILLFAWSKKDYFLFVIPLCFFVFFLPNPFPLNGTDKLWLLFLTILSYWLLKKPAVIDFLKSYSRTEKVVFLLISLYAGFAMVGNRLFLYEFPIKQVDSKICLFLLFSLWLHVMAYAFLYVTELCKQKAYKLSIEKKAVILHSPFKVYLTFLGIILACWIVYFIAFFPAVMSSDSLGQWSQATGRSKLSDWHPVFHTLFNKVFISIYKSPASIAMAQILFMTMVAAGFFLFLYQKGVPLKWLLWSALLFALIPANGIMSVTLWKDVPFTTAMIWISLVLAKIATDNSYFDKKWSYAELIPALVTSALFRHNGILVYVLVIAVLLVYFLKTRKASILICIAASAGLIGLFKAYISNPKMVIANPPAVKLMAPFHGLAAVRYYNGQLSKEAVQTMEQIVPDSIWLTRFRPCSSDEYLFRTNRPFVQNLSRVSTGKTLQLYGITFIHNPYLIIRDRLLETVVLWDVYENKDTYNDRYNTELESNTLGLSAKDNELKQALKSFLEYTVRNADFLMWRSGFYIILLLLLLVNFLKKRKAYIVIFIPLIACNLSLAISMTYQTFRYVYYIPMLFGFLWLLYLATAIKPVKVNEVPVKE